MKNSTVSIKMSWTCFGGSVSVTKIPKIVAVGTLGLRVVDKMDRIGKTDDVGCGEIGND